MTDRTEALDALIAAVDAGDRPWREWGEADWPHAELALCAFDGSLDAALRLHEALLPGWDWDVTVDQAMVSNDRAADYWAKVHRNPARAWLLAILRAYRAKEGG